MPSVGSFWLARDRQVYGEGCAFAKTAMEMHGATMDLGNVLDDREPEANTIAFTVPRVAAAEEAFEYMWLFIVRDACPRVGDLNADMAVFTMNVHLNLTIHRRVLFC